MSEENVAWRPVLRLPGMLRWISPATVAEARKVRFITALAPSQLSSPARSPSTAKSGAGSATSSSPQISSA